jgi:hypothetical protein
MPVVLMNPDDVMNFGRVSNSVLSCLGGRDRGHFSKLTSFTPYLFTGRMGCDLMVCHDIGLHKSLYLSIIHAYLDV